MGIASLVLGIVSLVCGCFLPGLQWIGILRRFDWRHIDGFPHRKTAEGRC